MTQIQRHRNPAKRRIFRDIGGPQRVARAGDEAPRHIRRRAQDGRDLGRRALHHQLDIAVLFAVAADGGLDHRLGAAGHPDRAHVAGRMGANVAHRIDHLAAQNRRGQPAVQRRGFAVLPDHQARDRKAQGFVQQLDRLDVVDAAHFPWRRGCGRADGGSGGDQVFGVQFIDGDQFRRAGIHRRIAQLAAMIAPAAATRGVNRSATNGGLNVFFSQNTAHLNSLSAYPMQ